MFLAFSFALILLFLPGLFLGAFEQNDLRLAGVPVAYLTSILVYTTYFIFNTYSVLKVIKISLCFIPFIIYALLKLFFVELPFDAMIYICSWIINIFVFTMIVSVVKERHVGENFFVLVACCIFFMAIGRYLAGYSYDTNPFVVLNRNASSFIVFSIFVLELQVNRRGNVHIFMHKLFVVLFLMVIIFYQSRSLPIALVAYFVLAYRKSIAQLIMKKTIHSMAIALMSILVLLLSPTGSRILEHMPDASYFEDGIHRDAYDQDRIILVKNSIEVINKNIFFGVGPGLNNYLQESSQSEFSYIRNARPHNFYLSFVSDFGVVGSCIFVASMFLVINQVIHFGARRMHVFYIPICILLLFNEYILIPDLWALWGGYVSYLTQSNSEKKVWL